MQHLSKTYLNVVFIPKKNAMAIAVAYMSNTMVTNILVLIPFSH